MQVLVVMKYGIKFSYTTNFIKNKIVNGINV